MKTVYRFYIDMGKAKQLSKKELMHMETKNRHVLYAWTEKDKVAERFIKERNMDMFTLRKSKMTKREIVEYGNKNRTTEISEHEFLTCRNRFKNKWKSVEVLTTWSERENVLTTVDLGLSEQELCQNYRILKNKYIDALNKLVYVPNYDLVYGLNEDYCLPDIQYDELNLFINLYGNTMKN